MLAQLDPLGWKAQCQCNQPSRCFVRQCKITQHKHSADFRGWRAELRPVRVRLAQVASTQIGLGAEWAALGVGEAKSPHKICLLACLVAAAAEQ